MARYFNSFPLLYYPYQDNFKLASDILRRVAFSNKTKRDGNGYIDYTVKEGDTPENLAARFYGTTDLHWTILLINDIINPYYDWVLSDRQFNKMVESKYGSEANETHHIETLETHVIVQVDQLLLLEDGEPLLLEGGPLEGQVVIMFDVPDIAEPVITITNRQYEIALNESKRDIILLRPEFINQAITELQRKLG